MGETRGGAPPADQALHIAGWDLPHGIACDIHNGADMRAASRATSPVSCHLLDALLDAPQASPFTGPDQAALEAMLREFQPA